MDENNEVQSVITPDPEVLQPLKDQMSEVFGADIMNDETLTQILGLLALEDDQFKVLAPIILAEYERQMNDANTRMELIQAINASGNKVEDILPFFEELTSAIDEIEELSDIKKNFLKQLLGVVLNAVNETLGIAKRVLNVPIELCRPGAKMPVYAHDTDAGADIYCPQEITINPGEQVKVPTGIKMACPVGYAMLVHPRSGLASRTKMRICNSIGLIDSGYRDEVCLLIENTDNAVKDITSHYDDDGKLVIDSILYGSPLTLGAGERIAQFRLVEAPKANFMQVNTVMEYEGDRGGGFGSSGMM
jgi:dUTP pyrophosphatase